MSSQRGGRADGTDRPDRGGPLAAVGVGVAMLVCCAGPVLIAAGALGAVGAAVRSSWMIVLAGVVFAGAVSWAAARRRRRPGGSNRGDSNRDSGDGCCGGWT